MSISPSDYPVRSGRFARFNIDIRPQPNEVTTTSLSASILRLCAPTLESLSWTQHTAQIRHSFAAAGLNSAPCFTRLRKLNLDCIDFLDSSMLDAFLHINPRTLGLNANFGSEYANFFRTRGTIPSLDILDWWAFGNHTGSLLCFLMANTHLSMLRLHGPLPAVFLERQLLPLLSNSFSKLTSLSLCLDASFISESALEMIGSLKSLQQIHLSSDYSSDGGRSFRIQIDHKAMRKHLQNLKTLKKIAFSNDSWPYGNESEGSPSDCDKHFSDVGFADLLSDEYDWEQMHRTRMLTEADQYGHIMPQLEWLFFGGIEMVFRNVQGTTEDLNTRIAVALNTKREWDTKFLRRMFGVFDG